VWNVLKKAGGEKERKKRERKEKISEKVEKQKGLPVPFSSLNLRS